MDCSDEITSYARSDSNWTVLPSLNWMLSCTQYTLFKVLELLGYK